MTVLYRNEPVVVWQVNRIAPYPDWVQEAFDKNIMVWVDDHVRILMAALQPSALDNAKTGAVGTMAGGFGGYGMYVLAYPGDYLDVSNHRVVSEKTFQKEYNIV